MSKVKRDTVVAPEVDVVVAPRSLDGDWVESTDFLERKLNAKQQKMVDQLKKIPKITLDMYVLSETSGLYYFAHPKVMQSPNEEFAASYDAIEYGTMKFWYEEQGMSQEEAENNARNIRFQFESYLGEHNPDGLIHDKYNLYVAEGKTDSD